MGSTWSPSNYNYGLLDHVVEKIAGTTYGSFLEAKIFKPLNLHRTTVATPNADNVAQPYLYSPDSPFLIGKPQVGDGTIMVGAMGLKSSVNDLLIYANSLMVAHEHQSRTNSTTTPGNPFAQVSKLFEPQVIISKDEHGNVKEEFAMGWVRTLLPSTMSQVSINDGLVEQYPTIGKGLKSRPVIYYHAGSVVGYLASLTLIPETKSAIVVLPNTLSNQDTADWVGMILLEALLNSPERTDIIPYAKEAAETWARAFPAMTKELDSGRSTNTFMPRPDTFVGQYFNEVHTWFFDIFQEEGKEDLWVAYCGDRENKYRLQHYRDDTMSFEIDSEESKRRGLWPVPSAEAYLLHFRRQAGASHMESILWKADWEEPDGEIFSRFESPLSSR